MKSIEERLMDRVFIVPYDKGCWLWVGKLVKGRPTFVMGHYGQTRISPTRFFLEKRAGPRPTENHFALHHCDVGMCVRPEHLYWGTKKQNAMDMVTRGRHRWTGGCFGVRGENAYNARWTESQVIEMRRLHWEEGESIGFVARKFGISSGQASVIIRGRRWASVKEGLPDTPRQTAPPTTHEQLLLCIAVLTNLRNALLRCAS